ncbi:hypothetical protein V6N11_019559 [Hibiscus sabdariffa]|uniref:Uncharacterized protein n=1 Tax=Hibiscus sabdariffa TaxID=183260 RepID=A0ABR1ZT09_9ROSI
MATAPRKIRRVVLLTSVMSPGAYLIQHFTHRHPMKMLKVADVMYVEKYFALVLLIFAKDASYTAINNV